MARAVAASCLIGIFLGAPHEDSNFALLRLRRPRNEPGADRLRQRRQRELQHDTHHGYAAPDDDFARQSLYTDRRDDVRPLEGLNHLDDHRTDVIRRRADRTRWS